jgi:histone-lysine N-methyltransferase SUV39H
VAADLYARAGLCKTADKSGLKSFAQKIADGVSLLALISVTQLTLSGLQSTETLEQGQFIDTYLGEVITKEECDRRASTAAKGKDSYIFTLDKFEADLTEDPYEVDGEFVGGPSRFINHSCDPNCAVYAVCRDKNNLYQYDLAFFALRDIKPREELTFDYLAGVPEEKDEEEINSSQKEPPIRCLCGSKNCRKILWK